MRGVVDDSTSGREWWRNAVVYQVYVRSFADHNGDGTGDLFGIIDRLPYLERLGVDAIWLNPCYPSPQRDHGYDVSDYFDIEPAYGSLDTFDQLINEANARGIRVLMDVVPNHCSSEHPWFTQALTAGRGSPLRERFYFADGGGAHGELPPNDWRAVFEGNAWTRVVEPDGSLGQWYLHTFTPHQPDLRADHPDVLDHFQRMFRFWFDRGVDGFRVDAVIVMGKEPGLPDATPPPPGTLDADAWQFNAHTINHASLFPIVAQWRQVFDDYRRDHSRAVTSISEAYTPRRPQQLLRYVGPSGFHQSFIFDLLLEPWNAERMEHAIRSNYESLRNAGASCTWTLNNHDVQRVVTRYGRADASSFYSGNNLINSTAKVDLALGERRARCAVMLLLALPGSAYLYMGEELGLPEVLDIPSAQREDPLFIRSGGRQIGRDGCRIPMPWTTDRSNIYGFSQSGVRPWLTPPPDWDRYAVDQQESDPTSMLLLYRELLRIRPLFVAEGDDLRIERRDDLLVLHRGRMHAAINFGVSPAPMIIDGTIVAVSNHDAHHPANGVMGNAALWWMSRAASLGAYD
jgi:alpha-glucosidase